MTKVPHTSPTRSLLLVIPVHMLMLCFWLIVGTALLSLISLTGHEPLFIAAWIIGALAILPLTIWSTLRVLRSLR